MPKATLTYTSDSKIAAHSQGWGFIPLFLTRTVERFYERQSQEEDKDIHMSISNTHDYIMLRISYPLILFPAEEKTPHPIVSNLLQVILL